jgi:FkbM family methyltransferase
MDFIKNLEPIIICDIGASPSEETDFIDDLFDNTNSKIVGFEPNNSEFQKLPNNSRKKYFNCAIGDGKNHELNICASPGMTSFLVPNYDYLKLFHGFEEWSKILKKENIKTKKLDDLDIEIDFLKVDAQGYESEIIKYGNHKIKNSLVIQIETSPIPLYKNEKPFSYVAQQLEKLGFVLHMFNKINSRTFKPMTIENDIYTGLHHLLQLDCVFIKNFGEIEKMNIEKLKKLILILFYSFKSYDLVDFLICKLDKLTNKNFISDYRKLVTTQKMFKKY